MGIVPRSARAQSFWTPIASAHHHCWSVQEQQALASQLRLDRWAWSQMQLEASGNQRQHSCRPCQVPPLTPHSMAAATPEHTSSRQHTNGKDCSHSSGGHKQWTHLHALVADARAGADVHMCTASACGLVQPGMLCDLALQPVLLECCQRACDDAPGGGADAPLSICSSRKYLAGPKLRCSDTLVALLAGSNMGSILAQAYAGLLAGCSWHVEVCLLCSACWLCVPAWARTGAAARLRT